MNYYQQYVGLLLQVIVIHFTANCLAENIIININDKKPIAVTSNAFLSFTLDPAMLHSSDAFTKNVERSINMARGLVPAYIRLGGSQSNSYIFERTYSHNSDAHSNDTLFEKQWILIHQWAKNVGLDIIVCIAPRYIENESKMHSKNSINMTELLSFNDLMRYNVNWQLGYECQTRCNLSGADLGQYVANLREMLKTFPRYSNSLITGPDIIAYKTAQQQKYLQDYLNSTATALSAITWHPDFVSVSLNNDSISMHHDNMVADKNELYKIISRITKKKPLWIAESKPEKFKHEYLGALIWTTRLGNAAKLGVQVIMRQPSNFYKATPDYWVSLLHKTLVGRQVLELKLQSSNESDVHLYSQCTKPSALYDKGAITIFGVNLTPKEITVNLKDLKIKTLHKYILSPDTKTGNKMFSEKVLLNNKPLELINDKKLPNIEPEIIIKSDSLELKLSSGNIGFWVIPNAKIKACVYSEKEMAENIIEEKLSKQHKTIFEQDNQEKKIDDMNNYQHSTQESERIKRDIGKKLVEIGLKKDNVFKKHSRFDMKDYINERKIKRKGGDEFRKDELFVPFNPRTADSGENNFYGFSRYNPIKGFPEGDIFITTGDSSEQNYDYVQDESNEKDSILENMQHRKELTQKHTEDNTWIEMENDHIPNEVFENVKLFNTKIKENTENYGDLLEAEFFPQEYENVRDNNKIGAVKILQEQLPEEKEEKRTMKESMQKLVDYYDLKEHDRDAKYEAGLALRRSTMPFNQLVKTPNYILNYQATNTKPEETKPKVESERKASNFFYQPSQTATINSNYNNYRTKNMKHEETNLDKEKVAIISNNRDNINTETIKIFQPVDVNTEYSIREIQYPILYNKRFKRSNRANIQKILSEEMIKESKENTKDCHCRIIRASHLSKTICYCRPKRDSQILDSSSEIESVNVGSVQSKINIESSTTKEEHEKIMTEEILSNTSVIESDYEEHDITAKVITTEESSTSDYKPSYVTQTIDVNSTSIMDNSEVNNISEEYHNIDKFNIASFLINSEFSSNNAEDLHNHDIVDNDVTRMFFRTESPDVQSENETTTYDPSQVVSKMFSNNQDIIVTTTKYEETIREKTQNFIKEQKTESSTYSTITENQENEERRDNNYKISLKSTNSLETTKRIAEEQMTTETILSNNKQTTNRALDSSESSESKTELKDNVQQNVENTQNIQFEAGIQSKKNIDTKKLKTIFRTAPLKGHTRHEEYLNKRADQINKLKEKLYARREKLLQQYLTEIPNEKKRNLKRRETWEKFYENERFRHLIDQGEFVSILNDTNIIYKDNNNEKYEIPIEFVSEQYKNIPNLQTRRNVRSDEHLERLLYFLLTRTNTQDGSNYDVYDHLKEDSEEIFSKQPILFYLLTKNSESPLNNILFKKLKNYLTSSQKDLEINQQNENKLRKCIVFIPTKDSYKMLEVKDYEDSLESFEIPYSESQYLARKILDSIIRYSDDESLEELVYEDLSDLLNENAENIPEIYSSESMKDVSVHVKDNGINHESEKINEQHKNKKIRYLEMKDQIRSDKCGMFLLFPSKENEKTRQRREIRNRIIAGIDQIGDETQSRSNKFISTESNKHEDMENFLNKNGEQEKEKMITRKNTETNYLETQINERNRDNLLEDFIRTRKKNYLYNNKILFIKNKEKAKSLKTNILKSDEKLPPFTKKIIPKSQSAIINDLENTQNFTEPVKSFTDNFEEKYNETVLTSNEERDLKSNTSEVTGNLLQIAIINIKKFIAYLSEISQIFM